MSSLKLLRLHKDLSEDLTRIAAYFIKEPKLTLVVRSPELADGDILMTNDDIDLAIASIQKMRDREPV